jgi:hypothetical protein
MAEARMKDTMVRAEEGTFELSSGEGPPTSGAINSLLDGATGVGLEEHGERGRRIVLGFLC